MSWAMGEMSFLGDDRKRGNQLDTSYPSKNESRRKLLLVWNYKYLVKQLTDKINSILEVHF